MTDTSEQSAESSTGNQTIDAESLLQASMEADQEGRWGNDGAFEMPSKEEPTGDRAPAEGGEQQVAQDKAEPSAEHTGHPTGPVRDEKGRFIAKPSYKSVELPEGQPPQAQESKYAKAKKEEERQKSVLAGFQERKEQWEAETAQREAELAAREQAVAQFNAIPRSADGKPYEFTAEQYAKASDDFYARGKAAEAAARKAVNEGDTDTANRALAAANQNFTLAEQSAQAAEQRSQYDQGLYQQQAENQHWGIWEQNMYAAIQRNPELLNDNNPVVREIGTLLDPNNPIGREWAPIIESLPNGFGFAAQVMQWKVDAERSALSDQRIKTLEAENADYRRRMGIRPTPSAGMPAAKTPDTMSESEFRAHLQQQAREFDNQPVF